MEDKLILPIEFDVNNPQLQQEINVSKKAISGVGLSVSDVEKKINTDLNAISNHALKSKSSFNGLQHSINQIGRELPAITYGFQTFAVGISNNIPMLADEIGRIRKENEALSASGQKGVPVWKQLVGSLFSWGTALSVGITLITVYGKEIGAFFKSLIKGNSAIDESKRKLELLNEVRKGASKTAAEEIASLKILSTVASDNSRSMDERRRAAIKIQELAKSYNQNISTETILIGNLKNEYNNLTRAIIASAKSKAAEEKIQENAKERLNIGFEVDGLKAANEERKKAIQLEGDKRSVMRIGTAMDDGARMDVIVETVAERQKASDLYTENEIKNTNKRIEALDKEDKFLQQFITVPAEQKESKSPRTNFEKLYDNILNISEDGLAKIKALDNEYKLIEVSDDDREIQLLKQKFADFRKVLEDENKKIQKYNKDNKDKKGFKAVGLIDVSLVKPIEQDATRQLEYTQNTNKLQKQFEEEYKLYEEYQRLVKETNEQYANERFADQLDAIKSFEQRLNAELAKIDPKSTNALEIKRREDLNKFIISLADKQKTEEDKRLMESLELVKSFNSKRLEIEKKYQDARKALGDKITPEQDQELQRKESKDVSKLASEELQQSDSWNLLFSDLDRLTVEQIDKLIQEIEARFDDLSVNFDPIDLDAIRKKLQEAKEEIIEKNPFKAVGDSLKSIFKGASEESGQSSEDIKDQWVKLSKATSTSFDFIADAVNSTEFLKDALGDTGATAMSALQGVALAAVAVSTAIKSAEKASVILAIIQAALVVVQAVFSFLDGAAKRRNEQLQKEQEYYNTLSETFDILIDKQKKLFSEQSGKSAMSAYKDALDMVNSKLVANRKSLEAWFAQGASWKSHSNWYKYDEELGRVLSRQKLLNMTGKEWEDLLRNQPELWSKLPQEVRDYAQSVMDSKEQTQELRDAMQEAFAGFSLDDLKGELEDLFTQTDLTFEDIGESFYKHMQKAILRIIQNKSMSAGMEKWYTNLVNNLDDGELSSVEAERLKQEYQALVEQGRKEYEAAMKAIGYDPQSTSSNSSLKSEGIARVSEQTGASIDGTLRANLDVNKRHLIVSERALEFYIKSGEMLSQQLKHQAAIEANTAEAVKRLDTAIVELKAINKGVGGKYGL